MKDVIQKAMKEATVKEREFAQELDKSQFEKIKEWLKRVVTANYSIDS